MGKKTRKEKIITNLRRELKKGSLVKEQVLSVSSPKKINQPKELSSHSFSFVLNDFKKTLVLTVLAISIEIMLYWVLELRP